MNPETESADAELSNTADQEQAEDETNFHQFSATSSSSSSSEASSYEYDQAVVDSLSFTIREQILEQTGKIFALCVSSWSLQVKEQCLGM